MSAIAVVTWAGGIASAQPPVSTQPLSRRDAYNSGVEDYRAERWGQAITKFQTAASSPDDQVAAAARFNLGNAHLARSLAADAGEPNPETAQQSIQDLHSAMEAYKSCLRLSPDDDDARFNFEAALKKLREKQQSQQQPEQQSQQQQNEQSAENDQSSKEPGKDQQAAPQQSNPQPNGDNSSPEDSASQPESSQPDSSQPESSQSSPQDQNEQDPSQSNPENDSKSNQPSGSNNSADPSQDKLDDSADAPNSGHNADSNPDSSQPSTPRDSVSPSEPPDSETEQDDEPRAGGIRDGKLTSDQDDAAPLGTSTETQNNPNQENPRAGADVLTQQEAEKLLQSIRDRDLLRRLRLDAAKRRRRVPVPRDW